MRAEYKPMVLDYLRPATHPLELSGIKHEALCSVWARKDDMGKRWCDCGAAFEPREEGK